MKSNKLSSFVILIMASAATNLGLSIGIAIWGYLCFCLICRTLNPADITYFDCFMLASMLAMTLFYTWIGVSVPVFVALRDKILVTAGNMNRGML